MRARRGGRKDVSGAKITVSADSWNGKTHSADPRTNLNPCSTYFIDNNIGTEILQSNSKKVE